MKWDGNILFYVLKENAKKIKDGGKTCFPKGKSFIRIKLTLTNIKCEVSTVLDDPDVLI